MLSIQELCDRLSISKDRVYVYRRRLEELGIDTSFITKDGKSHVRDDLVEAFDRINKWMKDGNKLKDFTLAITPQVLPRQDDTIESRRQDNAIETTRQYAVITPELIQELAIAVTKNLKPADPFWYIDRLRMLARFGIEITSSELRSLIGIKTLKGDRIKRGSFEFIKVGKIGLQSAWRVEVTQI